MTEEQRKEIESLKWWHRIHLTPDYTTPGICPHGHPGDFESRFGLPKDLIGLSVLDVGGYDGLFSFECEKRRAKNVDMIDIYQGSPNKNSNRPFQLAKEILNSKVFYNEYSLENFMPYSYKTMFDIILYFGVMYHIENPLGAVKKLMQLVKTGGTILVETAITNTTLEASSTPILEYRPGHDNDPTNQFYPNTAWIKSAFLTNGAKSVEVVYKDPHRATYRVLC
jgi:tRNA (mo5U34)-methyltransferase